MIVTLNLSVINNIDNARTYITFLHRVLFVVYLGISRIILCVTFFPPQFFSFSTFYFHPEICFDRGEFTIN